MPRFFMGMIILILLSVTPIIDVFAQSNVCIDNYFNNTETRCCCIDTQNTDHINEWIIPIISAIITGIIGVALKEIIVDKIKKRNLYFIPYTQWAIRFSGAFHEFRELCDNIKDKNNDNSATDVISHLWSIHGEVEEGYKWLSMVKKINTNAGDALDYMMDFVDRLWHKIETENPEMLKDHSTQKDFKEILTDLNKSKTKDGTKIDTIAELIKKVIKNEIDKENKSIFTAKKFDLVEKIIGEKIPTGFWKSLKHHFVGKPQNNTTE